ncbi:TPA: hypothetical protein ACTZ2U_005346 [Bacillus cereus]
MEFEEDFKKLIDLIWTKNTDEELVNEVILFFQNEEMNIDFKVDLLMEVAMKMDIDYYKLKRDEYDKKYNNYNE